MADLCILCNSNPTIQNSHVIPKFIVNYIKENSITDYLRDSWKPTKIQDGHKGPYLCSKCDNEIVSAWEVEFKNKWFDPFIKHNEKNQIVDESVLKFLLSLLLRYSEFMWDFHASRTDSSILTLFKDKAKHYIEHPDQIGTEFHIYIANIHPISETNDFLPGINHLLFNSYDGITLPAEQNYPSSMLVWIPSFVFLFSENDLNTLDEFKDDPILNHIYMGSNIDTSAQNLKLLILLKTIFNRKINQMNVNQKAQKDLNKLKELMDKDTNKSKMFFKAREFDIKLMEWQKTHKSLTKRSS